MVPPHQICNITVLMVSFVEILSFGDGSNFMGYPHWDYQRGEEIFSKQKLGAKRLLDHEILRS